MQAINSEKKGVRAACSRALPKLLNNIRSAPYGFTWAFTEVFDAGFVKPAGAVTVMVVVPWLTAVNGDTTVSLPPVIETGEVTVPISGCVLPSTMLNDCPPANCCVET